MQASQLRTVINDKRTAVGGAPPQTKAPLLPTMLVCVGLIALALACFFRTMKDGYFLADDFGAVGYVAKVFQGRWDLFWANWTGNYMGIPSMNVYRPWQIVTLYLDFVMAHGTAFGYYFTNFRYYAGDALLLFAICRQLTSAWSNSRSLIASGLAAALFIVNPLHCETMSWVVARVDSECAFYYLGGLWFYLLYRKQQRPIWMVLAVAGFWFGILVKEMAIGFPLLCTALSFLAINERASGLAAAGTGASTSWLAAAGTGIKRAIKESAPIWVSTALYFIIRYLALGTIVGGYTGAIGDDQAHSALQRWLDPDCYYRLFFPFATSLYPKENALAHWLSTCYAVLAAVFAVKFLRKEIPGKLSLFCGIWMVSALMPIYKLWGMGMDLEGARFCFFFTMAFAVAISLLTLAPSAPRQSGLPPAATISDPQYASPRGEKATAIVAALALSVSVLILYKACLKTNALWVHAGKEVHTLFNRARDLFLRTPANAKIIVLGIPKNHHGAHEIYNGITFRLGLTPPFSPIKADEKYLTFDPLIWGPAEFINATRFKSSLANGAIGPFVWNSRRREFIDASLKSPFASARPIVLASEVPSPSVQAFADGHATVQFRNGIFTFTKNQEGDGLQFNNLLVDPRQYDFLQFEYRLPAGTAPQKLVFQSKWHGDSDITGEQNTSVAHKLSVPIGASSDPALATSEFQTVRIPVSHFWRWYTCGHITDLELILPPVPGIEVRHPVLTSDTSIRPQFKAIGISDDGSGVFNINNKSLFHADASNIPGATQLKIECSKANYFFDQVEDNEGEAAIFASTVVPSAQFDGTLPGNFAPQQQYCEVRVRALDASGNPVGEYSDPAMIRLN